MKINKKGVSLPELLAVIVIMGLIAAISIPAFSSMIKNAKKDKYLSELRQLYAKIDSVRTTNNVEVDSDFTTEMVEDIIADYNYDVPFYGSNTKSLDYSIRIHEGNLLFNLNHPIYTDETNGYYPFDVSNSKCGVDYYLDETDLHKLSRYCVA